MGIGTDIYPHNMIEKMRYVAILSPEMSENVADVKTTKIFDAATLGSEKALGRKDIGRLAVGPNTDLVVVDVTHPAMRPIRDPVRSRVYAAREGAIRTVFLDGKKVVDKSRVLTMHDVGSAERLEAHQRGPVQSEDGRLGRARPPNGLSDDLHGGKRRLSLRLSGH